MLTIEFKVDKDILARKMISKSCLPTEFADFLWNKYNDSYKHLQKDFRSEEIDSKIISEVQTQKFFNEEVKKSKSNLTRIKRNWLNSQAEINSFLTRIMKTELNLNVICYVVSPEMNAGQNINNNSFVWGHKKGVVDKNYDLVYLVHEALHSFFAKDVLSHAIIENIADSELSKFLNNSSLGYSEHSFTQESHVKIFPFWNLYMNCSKDEIKQEQANENINYDISKFEKYRDELSKMNIKELVSFLQNATQKITFKTHYEII